MLEFTAHAGVVYAIEKCGSLATDPWTTLQDNITGQEGTLRLLDSIGSASRFYRLRVAAP